MQQPLPAFPKVLTIDFISVKSKVLSQFYPTVPNAFPKRLMLSECSGPDILQGKKKKKNQHFRSSQNTILITLFSLNIFHLFFYCFYCAQLYVISNYKRSFMKLHYVVLCFVLYVTQDIYLQKFRSIKIYDRWRIIRPSHTTI